MVSHLFQLGDRETRDVSHLFHFLAQKLLYVLIVMLKLNATTINNHQFTRRSPRENSAAH